MNYNLDLEPVIPPTMLYKGEKHIFKLNNESLHSITSRTEVFILISIITPPIIININ